jgi:Tol biopolymer transport system component
MKAFPRLWLIFVILLAACVPQVKATSVPTPVFTDKPPSTETPEPIQTLESTPIPVGNIPLDACAQIIEYKISSAGNLEVVYAGGVPSQNVLSKFGMAEYTGLWVWSDDTQAAIPFPLPQDALGPKLSADHRWIVFRRDRGERQSELWAIDTQGQNEKKLVIILFDEIQERYPNLAGPSDLTLGLNYDWVPNSDKILYSIVPGGGIDIFIYDTVALLEVNSGQVISLAKPGEEVSNVKISPDGSQAAVLTRDELRLLNAKDGQVQFTLPMALNSYGVERSSTPAYSPDGKYVIDFAEDGIVRVDPVNGQSQIIPLKYSVVVPGGGESPPSLSPDFTWAGSSTLLLPTLNSDHQPVVLSPEGDPNMTFTVWRVDLNDETAHQTQSFIGFQPSVVFSPDGKRLAFQKFQGVAPSQRMELFLADLATGQILETIEDGVFEGWSPASDEYIYSTGHPTKKGEVDNSRYYLGHIGEEPILMNWSVAGPVGWVDRNRLVMDCKIRHIP